jgi:peptidoglycan/xylan/chitin deacetylase (PgdA/CDA1 family)
MKIAVTIDVESDSAAFANKITGVQGVKVGLPKYVDFLQERGYPLTVFIACDILQYLDAELLKSPYVEVASHGYEHTYPPHYMLALSLKAMEEQISKSKYMLERFFKKEVVGFRAHGLAINPKLMKLIEKYYVYDSSVILHRNYQGKVLRSSFPYCPSSRCVVEEGEMSVTELPVFSRKILFLQLPFVGSYIRLLPERFFCGVNDPLIVLDLHCQDVVGFKNWKYQFVERHLTKLEKIFVHYENRGFKFSLMKDIVSNSRPKLNASD